MSQKISEYIEILESMKKYPEELHYIGDLTILNRKKVSIVGSRKLSNYTREYTYRLAKALSKRGVCIVSGAAMGVDAIAHQGAGTNNTIAVVANGIDIRYPMVNRALIQSIEEQGLVISQFKDTFRATAWSFVVRNELVVALGDVLIVTEANLDSGSMRSVEYAIAMGKKIYVLPHRLGESSGTQNLVQRGKATVIHNIEVFASTFGEVIASDVVKDAFFYFCQTSPTFTATVEKYGDRVYESELEGLIRIEQGIVRWEGS